MPRPAFTSKRRLFVYLPGLVLAAGAIWMFFFPGSTFLPYTMPRDANLTLGLFGKDGQLLRWVVQDSFRRAGRHVAFWNGCDQWGRRVPEGSYAVKALYHAPLTAEYLMTVGNPGTPPWPTADGKGDWLCDEANPQAVATDGQWVFLGSPGCEKGFSIIALDASGQRQWGANEPKHLHPRCLSLALEGNDLYALYSGPEAPDADHNFNARGAYGRALLVCFDKRTGSLAKFSRGDPLNCIAKWPYQEKVSWLWDLRNEKSFSPATYAGQPRYACHDVGESSNALGIAAIGGKLYVSLHHDNKLLMVDAETGRPTGEEIALPAPAGLCATRNGRLLVISGTRVLAVDPATSQITLLIDSRLAAPSNITTDREGNIYVSDWAGSFQVKVFDQKGRFLHAVGKEGGRPWVGPWDPAGMLLPRGVAVTDQGKLWVAEDDGSPGRISVWAAESGKLLKDYLGPVPYGGGTNFWIDPQDPTLVNALGTRFRVDPGQKTSVPEAIAYRRRNRDDPFTPNGHGLQNSQVRIMYHNGHEYAVAGNLCSILQRQGDIYRPVAALGAVAHHLNTETKAEEIGQVIWDSDVGYRLYPGFYPKCFEGHAGDNYMWTDLNGDNLVQPEEMHWAPMSKEAWRQGAQGRLSANWGIDIASDWSLFFTEKFLNCSTVFRLAARGWTESGAPIYDLADAKPIIFDARTNDIHGLHLTGDGRLIISYNFESKTCPDAMRCYDLDGHMLWAIAMPKRLAGQAVHANNAIYDFQIPGLGDVVCTWLYHGSLRPYLITSDGLYVGTLLDDTLLARTLHNLNVPTGVYVCSFLDTTPTGPAALWTESAKYFHQAADGTCYLINGGNQQENIFRIKGLEAGSAGRF